jgi:hypothetical protein
MGQAAPVNRKAAENTAATGQKKGRSKGAAKFREETPRKGHGMAIKDRDTALQQYGRAAPPAQANFFAEFKKRQLIPIPNY